jgi:hypothetical protein
LTAAQTFSLVAWLILASPLSTRLTVALLTPAAVATSAMVIFMNMPPVIIYDTGCMIFGN